MIFITISIIQLFETLSIISDNFFDIFYSPKSTHAKKPYLSTNLTQ